MKLKLLLFLILLSVSISAKPVLNNWVVDEAGILSPETEAQLTALFESVEKQTTAEMAVVTVKSLEGEPIEEYSISLAHNNLGKADKDNGLLILVAVDDREYRIEVGQGLEGDLNDAKVGRIGREYFIPNFQEGDYERGILLGANEIAKIITKDAETIEKYSQPEKTKLPLEFYIWLAVFIFIIINSIIQRKKGKGKGHRFFFIPIGGFGRNSGGFGGFGGGNFGGGGAGGRWMSV